MSSNQDAVVSTYWRKYISGVRVKYKYKLSTKQ